MNNRCKIWRPVSWWNWGWEWVSWKHLMCWSRLLQFDRTLENSLSCWSWGWSVKNSKGMYIEKQQKMMNENNIHSNDNHKEKYEIPDDQLVVCPWTQVFKFYRLRGRIWDWVDNVVAENTNANTIANTNTLSLMQIHNLI